MLGQVAPFSLIERDPAGRIRRVTPVVPIWLKDLELETKKTKVRRRWRP